MPKTSHRAERIRSGVPRWGLGGASLLSVVVLVLTQLPSGSAMRVAPAFQTQCYGTQEGTVVVTNYGTTSAYSYNNNYSNGSIQLSSQSVSASGGTTSGFEGMGWISMGPGPTAGLCFTPHKTNSSLSYRFAHVVFSANLSASCTGGRGTATSSYNFDLKGNIYDLSLGRFVWSSNLATLVGSHVTTCKTGHSNHYLRTFNIHTPVYVNGTTTQFSLYDRYWFIVTTDIVTTTSTTGTGSVAKVSVSGLSLDLAAIRCSNC